MILDIEIEWKPILRQSPDSLAAEFEEGKPPVALFFRVRSKHPVTGEGWGPWREIKKGAALKDHIAGQP